MADFDIPLLRTFASVAESGGFARAGERVHRTQSTISQQIKKLEMLAGRQLLVRNAHTTALTPDGERMLAYARRILALHDEARNLFAEDLPELVRIGVVEDHVAQMLPRVLGALAASHPGVRFEVRCAVSAELAADLAEGQLDVALYRRLPDTNSANSAIAEPGPPDVATWPDTPLWVGSANTAAAQSAAKSAAQLAAQEVLPLVLFPHGCIFRAYALAQLQTLGRPWRLVYTSPNVEGVLAAIEAGLGVSLLSKDMLSNSTSLQVLGAANGLPPPPATQLVLRAAPTASGPAAQAVVAHLQAQVNVLMGAHEQARF